MLCGRLLAESARALSAWRLHLGGLPAPSRCEGTSPQLPWLQKGPGEATRSLPESRGRARVTDQGRVNRRASRGLPGSLTMWLLTGTRRRHRFCAPSCLPCSKPSSGRLEGTTRGDRSGKKRGSKRVSCRAPPGPRGGSEAPLLCPSARGMRVPGPARALFRSAVPAPELRAQVCAGHRAARPSPQSGLLSLRQAPAQSCHPGAEARPFSLWPPLSCLLAPGVSCLWHFL